LNWDDQDVTVGRDAKLIWTESNGSPLAIRARNFTLQGVIRARGLALSIHTSENIVTEGRGRVEARRRITHVSYGYASSTSASVALEAGGKVLLTGANINLSGASAEILIDSGGDIQVDSQLSTKAFGLSSARIQMVAQESIRTSKRLAAQAGNPRSGGQIVMYAANGNLTTAGPLLASSGKFGLSDSSVFLRAAADVAILEPARLLSGSSGSEFVADAGGSITILGDIIAKTISRTEYRSPGSTIMLTPGGTGKVVVPGTLKVSCSGDCLDRGLITIRNACYVDLTGAKLSARPTGEIAVRCECVHAAGGSTCDQGCVGLDAARFNPPRPFSLPPCGSRLAPQNGQHPALNPPAGFDANDPNRWQAYEGTCR
jgi:hypothetical protein